MNKYKVGDKIQSAKNHSDVTTMKAVWVGKIYKVQADNDEGGCYETLGVWKPIKDKNGNVSKFWETHNSNELPTLRQLYGIDLVKQGALNIYEEEIIKCVK